MKQNLIQNKFSKIYSILNVIFYFYIFLIPALLLGALALACYIEIDFSLLFSDVANIVGIMGVAGILFLYFGAIFSLLYLLRKVVARCKNGQIFTEENKKSIQKLFVIFSILLVVLFAVISGGIFILFSLVFLWVLYEIFFIAFDYKQENDSLKEENNLTI